MKHYKTVEVPAKTEKRFDYTTCDTCKKKIIQARFRADEVIIKYITGTSYPEGGSGKKIKYDICPDCFEEKIIPFLESLGAKVEYKDWDC